MANRKRHEATWHCALSNQQEISLILVYIQIAKLIAWEGGQSTFYGLDLPMDQMKHSHKR
ncbi:hypothetical protein D918_08509 [Trichuris suis]|uniref:Uncharacterized protein n=1 Tax=Trichuris suis TaxID=68888 RepID=A0A085M537_9BILA|nr:hypothetical protein M513_06714 [Trichuris suis]KHJ41399.1 hypothetical protein D918_08509 [Trichuris suis]